jgi:hypothetical protein
MTMFLGIVVFFFAADFPDRNRFLTQAQTRLILKRVEDDRGDSVPDEPTLGKVLKHLMDWKLWVYGMCFASFCSPSVILIHADCDRFDAHDPGGGTLSSLSRFRRLTSFSIACILRRVGFY